MFQKLLSLSTGTEGLLISLFLAVLFLQSGADKITDRKGNLEWLTGHFAKSPFKNIVPLLLTVITLTETAAGILCLIGAGFLLTGGAADWARYGAELAAANLLMLFLGQRIAKDYAGAAGLVPYFILSVFGILVLS